MKNNKYRNSGDGLPDEVRENNAKQRVKDRGSPPERERAEHSDIVHALADSIMRELDHYFLNRSLTYISGQREMLETAAQYMLGDAGDPPMVIPLLPGTGKSTLLRATLRTLGGEFETSSEYAKALGGIIIVVEKTIEAYELRDLLNALSPGVCHVVESPNDFNITHGGCLRDDVQAYADCAGRACPQHSECPLMQAAQQSGNTPVLIVLHARYQRTAEDMSAFRTWVGVDGKLHERSLLIVDEAPMMLRENVISISEIANLERMISRFKPSYRQYESQQKMRLLHILNRELRRPFLRLIQEKREAHCRLGCVKWDECVLAGFSETGILQLREQLNAYFGSSAADWLERVDALVHGHALFSVGQEFQLNAPRILDLGKNAGLRTFILSGSANFSPELSQNPSFTVMQDAMTENYDHLRIIVQHTDVFSTTKTAMQHPGNRDALAAWLRNTISFTPPGQKALVVTYQAHAASLWRQLEAFHDRLIPALTDDQGESKAMLPYFGGMNGSNLYAEARHVICAGLGRFENGDYLNRALAYDFSGEVWEQLLQAETSDCIQMPCVEQFRDLTIARDLVQLLFRSALRRHAERVPVILRLIQPPAAVVEYLADFFAGCTVDHIYTLPDTCLLEAGSTKRVKGEPTHAAKVMTWFKTWDGSRISVQQIQKQIGITSAQWKEARKNKLVQKYIERNVVSHRESREKWYQKRRHPA